MPPAAAAAGSSSSSSFAPTLHASLVRLGLLDPPPSSSAGGSDPSSHAAHARLVAALQPESLGWLEHALAAAEEGQPHELWRLINSMHRRNALSESEWKMYQSLVERQQFVSDRAELSRSMASLGVQSCAEEEAELEDADDEDEDIDALEREIEQLTNESAALNKHADSLRLSREQLHASLRDLSSQRSETERALDAMDDAVKAEWKRAASTGGGNTGVHARSSSLRCAAQLDEQLHSLNEANNATLRHLADQTNKLATLLRTGKHPNSTPSTAAAPHSTFSSATATASAASSFSNLPALSAPSALDADGTVSVDASTSLRPLDRKQAHPNGAREDESNSPFLLHHRSLHARYLAQDDSWARALNRLFRAQFGSGSGSSGNGADSAATGRCAPLLTQNAANERHECEVRALLLSTPHARHLRRTGRGETLTPARGRIGAGAGAVVPSTVDEMKTPPHASSSAHTLPSSSPSSSAALSPPSSSAAPAPLTSSTLLPSLHAEYSSELSRLYDLYPESQSSWLHANLLYLGSKAALTAQHGCMVAEERSRAMSRQQLNAQLAELGIQAGTLRSQLSSMLTAPEEDLRGFANLWASLRGLQMLETLGADVEAKAARQAQYTAAQDELLHLLLAQRARHEVLLASWRVEWGKLQSARELLASLSDELAREVGSCEGRLALYARLRAAHESTATMHDPARLSIDARNGAMGRVARMVHAAGRSLGMMPAQGQEQGQGQQYPPLAFDRLLDLSRSLSLAPGLQLQSLHADGSARLGRMRDLAAQATAARRSLFEDGGDVAEVGHASAPGGMRSTSGAPGYTPLDRLQLCSFPRLLSQASGEVDRAAEGLNALVQARDSKVALLRSSDPRDHSAVLERALRGVWSEFIQAPERLDQRMQQIRNRIQAMES